jgi:hypothetical protein
MLTGLPGMLPTVWGSFGFGAGYPALIDHLLLASIGFALVGLPIALLRRQARPGVGLLAAAFAAALLVLALWVRSYAFSESARLLAPAASASAILAALGGLAWFPRRLGQPAALAIGAVGLAFAGLTPGLVIIPAYEIPHPLEIARANALPASGRARFDNGIELIHASLGQRRVEPGEALTLTLLWRATLPVDDGYIRLVEAIDARGARLARADGPPLEGRLSARFWDVGAIYEETVALPISAGRTPELATATVFVGWHRPRAPYEAVTIAGSAAVSAPAGEIRLRSGPPARYASDPPLAIFAPWAQLEQATLSGDHVRLVLRAIGEPDRNITLFAHGYDADGRIVAQQDAPLKPASPLWLSGDEIVFDERIAGLSGAARIAMGLYDPVTGARLVATDISGARFTDDIVTLR